MNQAINMQEYYQKKPSHHEIEAQQKREASHYIAKQADTPDIYRNPTIRK
jgi:hypothetical protein